SFARGASKAYKSLPIEKSAGDDVFAGTQNLTGAADMQVSRVGNDTTLGKVREMILQAESSRTPAVRIIDRYASFYTPTILMVACIVWCFTENIDSVIAFLVISCPCAIVLATPSAVVAAVAAAARLGIFIKNVTHLELASRITAFVFDKTGTLTDGVLSVVKLHPFEGTTSAELLQVAASAESSSNHPTAVALRKLAEEAEVPLLEISGFREIHGRGVECNADGKTVRVGRADFLRENGIYPPEEAGDADSMSVVYVVSGEKALGWIGLRDKLRKEAPEMISELRALGVKSCSMVTGVRNAPAAEVAGKLAIDSFESNCLPQSKVAFVEKLRKDRLVAFVGDGVNDAPALAAGDMGIAMGAIGSDIAVNSASIALMNNDLRRIPALLKLSKKSRFIVNENLVFGMVFVFGGMILSIAGIMTPVWAAILHAASTLVILFNSSRLVRTGEGVTLNADGGRSK
ncbi:MAG: cation-translocating P-type ATPase, partial [Victivallaceae bacterium]|nr:cation-translocating P-type ATPase [Victivallaceae bacterium]